MRVSVRPAMYSALRSGLVSADVPYQCRRQPSMLPGRARLGQGGWLQGDVAGRRFRLESRECEFQLLVLGGDLRTMAAVILGHAPQQIAERRHTVARLLRKVRAPKERGLLARGQEHGQRPAAV